MDIFKSLFTSHNLSLFEIIKHYATKTNISQFKKLKNRDTSHFFEEKMGCVPIF